MEELVQNFPYFQLGNQLLAKIHHEKETSLASDKLKISSIYASSRTLLRKLIKTKIIPTFQHISNPLKEEIIAKTPNIEEVSLKETETFEPTLNIPEEKEEVILKIEEPVIFNAPSEEPVTVVLKQRPSPLSKLVEFSDIRISENDNIEQLLNFDKPSNYDFLKEASNINFENLFPKKKPEPNLINDFLIPDGLGIHFGISDSYLGEVILSTQQLEENNSLELVLKNKKIDPPTPSSLEIIDSFLEKNPRITSLKDLDNETFREDLSKKKAKGLSNKVTETMANIYLLQGNVKKAKNIFEKLIVLFPEKKAYFAKKLRDINE